MLMFVMSLGNGVSLDVVGVWWLGVLGYVLLTMPTDYQIWLTILHFYVFKNCLRIPKNIFGQVEYKSCYKSVKILDLYE